MLLPVAKESPMGSGEIHKKSQLKKRAGREKPKSRYLCGAGRTGESLTGSNDPRASQKSVAQTRQLRPF